MSKITGEIAISEDIPVTIKITMSLKEWKTIKEQLNGAYPAWKFRDIIYEAVNLAEGVQRIVSYPHDE